MKTRIRTFMDYKSITPVELADLVGVQRSNVSHILNGRNKPGALFIEKFLLAFPEISARWLLTGEGEMIAEKTGKGGIRKTDQDEPDHRHESAIPEQMTVRSEPEVSYGEQSSSDSSPVKGDGRQIDKVILFYTDGTFVSYHPG